MTAWYVHITYATPDGDATHDVGPTDRLLAEILCLSMADGYTFPGGGWVHVKRARIIAA